MSATRLRRLAGIILAVLYGVVGVTGESLHYLTSDPVAIWATSAPATTVVYYHTHGPDYHGHFHRHTHHGGHSHGGAAAHDWRDTGHGAGITDQNSTHDPHACPLLALVSTLKLGHAAGDAPLDRFDILVTRMLICDERVSSRTVRLFCARGPPPASIA